jgi:hypothetical protein
MPKLKKIIDERTASMSPNYPQMVAEAISDLPVKKQAEVYHFVKLIKSEKKLKHTGKNSKGASVFDLFGSATSKVTDASINHDQYLYE